MEYWLNRGFKLESVQPNNPNLWIASKPGQAAVVEVDFWDNWTKTSEWFSTVERARIEARELATV